MSDEIKKEVVAFTRFNLLKNDSYDSISSPSKNELWAIETDTYSDDEGNWYRIYADGWCEQGGNFGAAFSSWTAKTVNFIIPFRDKFYDLQIMTGYTSNTDSPCINAKTPTYFSCTTYNSTGNSGWSASGYIR